MTIVACSWDGLIWAKSKDSKTALFRFVVDEKAGYIDSTGKIVIPARYRTFGNHGFDDFFEGVASVDILQATFIDSNGEELSFAPYVVNGDHFSEGVIGASVEWGVIRKYGFIDHRAKLVVPAKFDGVDAYSDGLAAVRIGSRYGYIDHGGRIAVPARFAWAEKYSEGLARVIVEAPCNYIGYGPCASANPSVLGFAEDKFGHDPRVGNCQYSFIDKAGRAAFPQRFPDAFDFTEGLAAVGDGKHWGFINRKGKVHIALVYDAVGSFSEGLARVLKDGKWGYIDKSGKVVIPPQYEYADNFSSGAAVVGKLYNAVWFIDQTGRRFFKNYRMASAFRLGLAHVTDGSIFEYIDRSGNTVFRYRRTSVDPRKMK